jgi:hypothetical protein
MVKKLEWHLKLNVLWVFKWKPRVWVVGFGLVDSLALVPFNLHISFHLFYLVFCSWINSQTFGTRLKWGWLSKTPILTISLWIRHRTCTHYIANDSCACEYYLKHTSVTNCLRRCGCGYENLITACTPLLEAEGTSCRTWFKWYKKKIMTFMI